MQVLYNLTIEQMARLGYRPILDPSVLAIKVGEDFSPETFKPSPDIFLEAYRRSHPQSPLVERIEAAVLKLDIKGYDEGGKVVDDGPPLTPASDGVMVHVPALMYTSIDH